MSAGGGHPYFPANDRASTPNIDVSYWRLFPTFPYKRRYGIGLSLVLGESTATTVIETAVSNHGIGTRSVSTVENSSPTGPVSLLTSLNVRQRRRGDWEVVRRLPRNTYPCEKKRTRVDSLPDGCLLINLFPRGR